MLVNIIVNKKNSKTPPMLNSGENNAKIKKWEDFRHGEQNALG